RTIAGHTVRVPSLEIETVGAGGGSIAWVDSGGALRVGPTSAGAHPGPACYGRGGTAATVTDANVVLGRLSPTQLLDGRMPLQRELAERAIAELGKDLGVSPVDAARGVLSVVQNNMLGAIRVVSVRKGYDPRAYALVAFGGAGPLGAGALRGEFLREHGRVYGYAADDEAVQIVACRLTAFGDREPPALAALARADGADPGEARTGERAVYFEDARGFLATPIYRRERLRAGHRLCGPAIVEQM